MAEFTRCRVLLAALSMLSIIALSSSLNAKEGSAALRQDRILRTRTFTLTIKPADAASADARTAQLFMTRDLSQTWQLLGSCEVLRGAADEVTFRKTVTVAGDGIYYFTTRAGDAAGMNVLPKLGATSEARVIVDTTKPALELASPTGHETVRAGSSLAIDWNAHDQNFSAQPVRLAISENHGRTWLTIASELPTKGTFNWTIPETQVGSLLVRAEATDAAHNAAWAITRNVLRVVPPLSAPRQTKINTSPLHDNDDAPGGDADGGNGDGDDAEAVAIQKSRNKNKNKNKPTRVAGSTDTPKKPTHGSGKYAAKTAAPGALSVDSTAKTKWPQMDANAATPAFHDAEKPTQDRGAWQAYLMGGNLVRQGRLKDGLRYFRTAVDADKNFALAWHDMAAVYRELSATDMAERAIIKAINIEPNNPLYHHTRGEIFQRHGIKLIRRYRDPQDLDKGSKAIHEAVKSYGRALELAQKQGRLAERAATYFRLGEICYFVNHDAVGARNYWRKVESLHSPTPSLDDVTHAEGTPEYARSLRVYQRYTGMKTKLELWQRWASEYLAQLAELERQGMMQVAPPNGQLNEKNSDQVPPPPQKKAPKQTPKNRSQTRSTPAPKAAYLQPGYGSNRSPSAHAARPRERARKTKRRRNRNLSYQFPEF